MFFEETYIKNLLKCNKCNEKFNDYEKPRSLPCGKIICSSCSDKVEKEAVQSKFKCICSNEHQISKEGFGINELALHLLTSKAKEMWRGKRYEQLKINLQKIEAFTRELKFNFENGSDKIKEHCNEQRRLVQLATENTMEELNKINEELITEIDNFEIECIKCYSVIDNSFKEKLNRLIDEAKSFLNEKQEYLKQIQLDEDELKTFNNLSANLQIDLNKELKDLKSKIFGHKLIRFNSNSNKINSSILGFIDYEKLTALSVISGSKDKTVKLWDLESGKCIKTFNHTYGVASIKQAFNNKLISGCFDGSIKIWDSESSECLITINAHTKLLMDILLISNDRFVTCSWDNTIKLFDLNTYDCIRTFNGHKGIVSCIDKLLNDRIVSCSSDTAIRIWDLSSGECLKILRGHLKGITSVLVFSDIKLITGSDGVIKIWDIESETCLRTLLGHSNYVRCIIKLSEDQIASCSNDKTIKIWNINNDECLKTIEAHSDQVFSLKKLSDNSILSCSADKTIKIWDIETLNCLKTLNDHQDAVCSLDLF